MSSRSLLLSLDQRDLAIEKIKKNIFKLDNTLEHTYQNLENKDIKKEYDLLFKEEEQMKKKQIKKLKELYNYLNTQKKEAQKKSRGMQKNDIEKIEADKKEILTEINKIEILLRKDLKKN